MRMRDGWRWAGRMVVVCALALGAGACGKKAPPRPPQRAELPEVKDLRAEVSDEAVALSWTLPTEAAAVAEFKLYRGQQESESEACPSCPRRYTLIKRLRVDPGRTRFQARDQGVPGRGRLFYRVVPHDRQGRPGPESNEAMVKVE